MQQASTLLLLLEDDLAIVADGRELSRQLNFCLIGDAALRHFQPTRPIRQDFPDGDTYAVTPDCPDLRGGLRLLAAGAYDAVGLL